MCLDADGKFEIFAGNGVPVLVDHHDSQQVADGGEEKAVHVVLHRVADAIAEDVENNLANDKEEDAEDDVAHRPAVLEGTQNKQNLAGRVDKKHDGIDDVGNDEDADGVGGAQAGPALEGEQ